MIGRPRLLLAVLCAATLAAAAGPGRGVAQGPPPDPFYLALLRDGRAEMVRGDAVGAAKSFRLACFGFLEQPVILAEGLVRLGLAQVALGDREAFVETFSRLAEVDERFAAYAPAAISPDERRSFEDKALEWVAAETLRASPAFSSLLTRKNTVDLAKLSPRERLRELEKRLAAEPNAKDAPHWRVLLAEDEVANERMAKAIARLEGVPDATDGGTAGCLRGRALAALKRCDEAVAALAACAAATSDAGLAEVELACLLNLERSAAARSFAARLAPAVAGTPAVRKAIARIPAAVPTGSNAKPQAQPASPGAVSPPAATKPASGATDTTQTKSPLKEEKAASASAKPAPPAREPAPVSRPPQAPKTGAPASPTSPATPTSQPANSPSSAAARPAENPAPAQKLTAEEEQAVATARSLLSAEDNRDELRLGLGQIRPVADRYRARTDLQLLAGEIAYRAGRWEDGVELLRRSSPNRTGPGDPTLRFYYAVCLYEAGDRAAAAEVASSGLEKLQHLPFVESYLQKIRAARP